MNKTTHLMHSKQITEASKEMVNDISTGRSQSAFDPSIDASGVIDLTVSLDGSWMKGDVIHRHTASDASSRW